MIFSLTDETYSLLCSVDAENPEEEKKLFRTIAILDQLYWILGSVLGAAIGDLITINTAGIEFSMTALFLVILLEQILHKENRLPAVIGAVSAVLFLILLGPDRFLLPALLLTCAGLFLFRTQVEGRRNG